jgi:hypothetical protein
VWWAFAGDEFKELRGNYNTYRPTRIRPSWPDAPERPWYQHYFHNVETFQTGGCLPEQLGQFDWASVPRLKYVRYFEPPFINREGPTDEHKFNLFLRKLQANKELKTLHLIPALLSNEAMEFIASLESLEELKVLGGPVSDRGMMQLKKCKKLKRLEIGTKYITPTGLSVFAEMPQLEYLTLQVSDLELLPAVAQMNHVRSFKELILFAEADDASLDFVKQLTELDSLLVHGRKITDEGIAKLKNMTRLKKLSVSGPAFDGHGLKQLRELRQLEKLYLNFYGQNFDFDKEFDQSFIDAVIQFKQLQYLYILFDSLTVDQAKQLLALPNLKHVDYEGTGFSDEELKELNRERDIFQHLH